MKMCSLYKKENKLKLDFDNAYLKQVNNEIDFYFKEGVNKCYTDYNEITSPIV